MAFKKDWRCWPNILVGGLSRSRMRVLAARVVGAHHMLDGASFIDTFRTLNRNYEFSQRTAYTIAMRLYRGGGLTKDAVYLRGLLQILRYLREGGELEPLVYRQGGLGPFADDFRTDHAGNHQAPGIAAAVLGIGRRTEETRAVRGGMKVLELVSG